jgi:hypothetical protein
MADLERERFEEDIPVRSHTVSVMASHPRPSHESVDRRQSLPGDLNKKVEKQKVKPRLSEGGEWCAAQRIYLLKLNGKSFYSILLKIVVVTQ